MKKTWLALTFSALALSSCKKEETPPPPPPAPVHNSDDTHYLDPSVSMLKFKPGTYWVYENDSSGVLDSVVVDSAESGFFNASIPHLYMPDDEIYVTKIHDFGNSRYYPESLIGKNLYRSFNPMGFPFGPITFHGNYLYGTNLPVGANLGGAVLTAKIPSMTMFSNTFYNLSKVEYSIDTSGYQEFYCPTVHYYSDTLGLIKKEYQLSTSTESWSLKRWNIVR